MHLVGVTGGKISVLILRFSTICNHETLCKINRDYFEDIIVMIIFFFFFRYYQSYFVCILYYILHAFYYVYQIYIVKFHRKY